MGTWTTATRTWAAGEVVTAANLNAQLRDFANGFGAWSTFTPTVTAGSGTFTSVSGSMRYLQVQKLVVVQVNCACTTVGTAGTDIRFTLPVTAAAYDYYGVGRNVTVGGMVELNVYGTVMYARKYDNSFPIGSGQTLRGTIVYEAA